MGPYVPTFGTGTTSDEDIPAAIDKVFDLRPAAIVEELDLLRPIYRSSTRYGHFGRELPDFIWEARGRVTALQEAVC